MITIAPLETFLEPLKEGDKDDQSKERDELVELTQAFTFK